MHGTRKPQNVEIGTNLVKRKLVLKSICATFSPVTPFFYWFLESWCQVQLENAIYSKFYLIIFEYHEIFTDLPITESAILSTLARKFEGCLGVEGWLKTGNKSHYFQAWFSLKVSSNFFSSFVDQRLGWVPFYQGCHHEETSDFGS